MRMEKPEEHRGRRSSSSASSAEDGDNTTFSAITAPTATQDHQNHEQLHKIGSRASKSSRASTKINRQLSQTDGYCLSVRGDEEDDEETADEDRLSTGDANTSTTEILVKWDENDPANPKNMAHARKWVIAIVVSLGSVCVYVMRDCLTLIPPLIPSMSDQADSQ